MLFQDDLSHLRERNSSADVATSCCALKAGRGPRGFARCTRGVNDSPERGADAPRCSGLASWAVAR